MVRAAQARSLMAPGDTMQAYQNPYLSGQCHSFAQDELDARLSLFHLKVFGLSAYWVAGTVNIISTHTIPN